ncbi:MAG: hypothetical protein SPI53_04690 [Erysipelotrichaceae bacterium]|nr:hypothetical protein [Erysipelotrichaceae bacterium]
MLKKINLNDAINMLAIKKLISTFPSNLSQLNLELRNNNINKILRDFENIDQYLDYYLNTDSFVFSLFAKDLNLITKLNKFNFPVYTYKNNRQEGHFKLSTKKAKPKLAEDEYYNLNFNYKYFNPDYVFESLYNNLAIFHDKQKTPLIMIGKYSDLNFNMYFEFIDGMIERQNNFFDLSQSERPIEDIIYAIGLIAKAFNTIDGIANLDFQFILDEKQLQLLTPLN